MLVQLVRSSRPSTRPKGLCQQDHVYMDKRILGNPLVHLHRNEQKAIDQSKHKAISEWDHLQVKALQHLELPKPTLVTMAFNQLFLTLWHPKLGWWIYPWVLNSTSGKMMALQIDPWVKDIICEGHQGHLGLSPMQYPYQIVNWQIIFLYNMPWTNIKIRIFNL